MKTALHTKIDKDVKESAQRLAEEMGIPLSTIINSHLREFVRSGNFSISREPKFKESVWKDILLRSIEAKEGKNISPKFKDIKSAGKWLNA